MKVSVFAILILSVVLSPTWAFMVQRISHFSFAQRKSDIAMSPSDEDPTKSFIAQIADGIQNALTNSPLNEVKKGVVKMIAGDYDKGAVRAKLDNLIAEKPVLMLSFTTCPFCLKAKALLDEKGAVYEVVELDVESDGNAIRAEMADMLGRTSVPAIWIGGQFIGGCNDGPMGGIVKLNESGKLDPMLSQVGALS